MKKVFILVLTLVLAVSLAACSFNPFAKKPDKSDMYIGSGETKEEIDNIVVDWVGGDIDVVYGKSDCIRFTEASKELLNASQVMRWGIENKTLTIEFNDQKSLIKVDVPSKDLKVEVPEKFKDFMLTVNTVDSDVKVNAEPYDMYINSVTGTIAVECEEVPILAIHSVSADVEIDVEKFSDLNVDTVSGKVTVNLPKDADCKGEITSLSGKINIQAESRKDNDVYTFGKGTSNLKIATLSGDILVKAK